MSEPQPVAVRTYGRGVQLFIALMAALALAGVEWLLRDEPPAPAPAGGAP